MAYEMSLGVIALKRLGYGSKANGDVAEATSDPRGFVRAELEQPNIFVLSDPSLSNTQSILTEYFEKVGERRTARRKAEADAKAAGKSEPTDGQRIVKAPIPPLYRQEALARVQRAVKAEVGFAERLVAFWSNHFAVSALKGGVGRLTAGSFEREAIRPFVLDKFEDMLTAVESHPAMLHYLDNAKSVGPASKVGLRRGEGLNENLGREIMELHTLGVGSGYTQSDVTNLARILTGWSFPRSDRPNAEAGTFFFRAAAHEPGEITLLGKSYADDGVAQGQSALRDIARRPETAHFIAAKLAQAFVADTPPKALVDRLAHTFHTTKGDLKSLTFALIDAPETWVSEATKMTTPYDFFVAHNRLLGEMPSDPREVVGPLRTLGMPIWTPPGPNGFPNTADVWASPEGMKLRLDYCAQLAERLRDPPNPSELLDAMCGGSPSHETKVAAARAESRQQGLALLLMSPEMQRS